MLPLRGVARTLAGILVGEGIGRLLLLCQLLLKLLALLEGGGALGLGGLCAALLGLVAKDVGHGADDRGHEFGAGDDVLEGLAKVALGLVEVGAGGGGALLGLVGALGLRGGLQLGRGLPPRRREHHLGAAGSRSLGLRQGLLRVCSVGDILPLFV